MSHKMFLLPVNDLEHIWQKAHPCLSALQHADIFLTGGSGFFGRWLLESIHYANAIFALDAKVMLLTRQPALFYQHSPHLLKAKWLTVIQGDIVNFTFPERSFTHILHAATEASASLNQQHPLLMFDTIVHGTRRVLEFAAKKTIKNFLFISSGAVYGKQPSTLSHVSETYLGAPNPLQLSSAYGIGKITAEHLCAVFCEQQDLNIKIARCFAFVGPLLPLSTHFAIGNFIFNLLHSQAICIHGDGSPLRSYLYAADLVIWLWTILCQGKRGEAYNVGSDQAISIKDMAALVATSLSAPLVVHIAKEYDPALPVERYVPNINRAKHELSLQPWIPLQDAILKTIRFHQNQ